MNACFSSVQDRALREGRLPVDGSILAQVWGSERRCSQISAQRVSGQPGPARPHTAAPRLPALQAWRKHPNTEARSHSGDQRTRGSRLSGCLRCVKAGAASLSRRCYIYDPAWTEPRTGCRGYSKTHTLHTWKKNAASLHKCAKSVSRALMHVLVNTQTLVFPCVAVPAEDHRGPRPADGGRSGVHLQLWERWPAQPLLWYPGMSAAEGLRVRSPTQTHNVATMYTFHHIIEKAQ